MQYTGGFTNPQSNAAGAGDVTSGSNITNNAIVRGDGGGKGVQDSGVLIDDSDNLTGLGTLNGNAVATGTNTGDQTITLTGDVTGTGTGSFAATLANTAVTPGSYTATDITVDSKGRITAASNGSGGGGTWGSITGTLSDQTDLQNALDAKAAALTADENYVTDAQLVVIGNTSGTNTGDQTSIVGISGTTAEFNTANTDGDFATLAGAETLTNKSIDCDNNTLTNVGYAEGDEDIQGMDGAYEGMAFDKGDISVIDDGGLQFEIEKTGGGGDMDFWIGTQRVTLDCTTGSGTGGIARVALTAGVDENTPSTNYIYVTASGATATLTASTSLPTGAFCWVGKVVVPDATTWASTGEYGIQRYTEAMENSSRGLFSHQREKLRALGALYISGVAQTTNITGSSPEVVHLATGSGSVYQLHRQSFPAFTTGPYYFGNGTNIYEEIANLGTPALELSDGTAITNQDRYNLVIWGAVNYSTGDCKLYVNVPTKVYGNNSQAKNDRDNSADYTVPDDMKSVAFLISRVCLRYRSSGGGTFEELGTYSLLGTPVGARSGGSGAVASNDFDDSQFRIYDTADDTKEIAFEASGISTATTRTLTVPDANGTITLNDSTDTLTNKTIEDGSYTNDFTVTRTATAVSVNSAAEMIIGVTSTASARTITLDTDDVVAGRIKIIKDESGAAATNNITIATEGSETIDGETTITISADYGVARVYSDGTNWFTF